ncbi:MAG: hypothetical protein AMXMBFR33_46110 [Candidatus Xenobia bacterium]
MKFSPEQIRAFERLSQDRNPLHLHEDYARRSPFGRPVVYGVCAVLACLGEWSAGRSFRLGRLKATFRKPLFVGVSYQMRIQDSGERVSLSLERGSVSQLDLSFTPSHGPVELSFPATASPASRQPRRYLPGEELSCPQPYALVEEALDEALNTCGLSRGQFPLDQLALLCWSSYYVGMECPGEQALFSSLSIEFGVSGSGLCQFSSASARFDERFNLVSINAEAEDGSRLQLSAFLRPDPVTVSLAEVRASLSQSAFWSGRHIFVSGSSRGFGSVLGQALSLQGARVAYHGRQEFELEPEIAPQALRLFGDASRADECVRLAGAIAQTWGSLDMCVLNASPPIQAALFQEQSGVEWLSFVQQSLACSVELARVLLPLLRPGGQLVLVSSTYLSLPKPQFSHYLAAKGALEGWLRGLALEAPQHRFVVARLPRMRTDQTNLPFDLDPALSTVEVAIRLLRQLEESATGSNYRLLDFQAGH